LPLRVGSDERKEGYAAFEDCPLNEIAMPVCPYTDGTMRGEEWMAGFIMAQDEFIAAEQQEELVEDYEEITEEDS